MTDYGSKRYDILVYIDEGDIYLMSIKAETKAPVKIIKRQCWWIEFKISDVIQLDGFNC